LRVVFPLRLTLPRLRAAAMRFEALFRHQSEARREEKDDGFRH
jgi:hypothetical protein